MNHINDIQRMRWSRKDGRRQYHFSTAIMRDEKSGTVLRMDRLYVNPRSDYPSPLTDQGEQLVNELIQTKGVTLVGASAFCIEIAIAEIFEFGDYHDYIVDLLNRFLFDGKYDGACAGPAEPPPPAPRIF